MYKGSSHSTNKEKQGESNHSDTQSIWKKYFEEKNKQTPVALHAEWMIKRTVQKRKPFFFFSKPNIVWNIKYGTYKQQH